MAGRNTMNALVNTAPLRYLKKVSNRDGALEMLGRIPGSRRVSVGADRGYDSRDFVSEFREVNITPHIAQ